MDEAIKAMESAQGSLRAAEERRKQAWRTVETMVVARCFGCGLAVLRYLLVNDTIICRSCIGHAAVLGLKR